MTQLLLFFTLATILNIPDKYTDFWRILRTNFQNVTFWGKIRCFYLCMLSFTWLFAWENKWECRTWFLFWEDLKFMSDNRRLLNCHRRWYSHSVQWVCRPRLAYASVICEFKKNCFFWFLLDCGNLNVWMMWCSIWPQCSLYFFTNCLNLFDKRFIFRFLFTN